MDEDPFDPYADLPEVPAEPDPVPVIEPGWWEVIGGAWRWMTDPTA
jgi:hypothetical protein